MTFSILGFCKKTKMTGVAITTSSISVGSRCPWVRANGDDSEKSLIKVIKNRRNIEFRQVIVIDINGITSHYTGKNILGRNSVNIGTNCIAAGNLLNDPLLTKVMTDCFMKNDNMHIAENLINSLLSGVNFGGEEGPTHSAALLVAHEHSWPLVDLRVDWSESCPVNELKKLWENYKPQMNDYILRALDPSNAPSYGVPGDE